MPAVQVARRAARREREMKKSDPPKYSECRRCIGSSAVWKQCLSPDTHGCSACKEVIEASAWNERKIKAHLYFNRDLVCPSCAKRGYAPSKYDEHQCDECLEKFGSLKFDLKSKKNKKRNATCLLVCKACLTKIRPTTRCSSCMMPYELKYWSTSERKRHFSSQHTKLVCKACRAEGFTPRNLNAYTCQACAYKFGANRFDKERLKRFKSGRRQEELHCLQCESSASSCKKARGCRASCSGK